MSDRFKQPKRKQELPKGKQAKCALVYSILVENLVADGIPHEVADLMATDVVVTVLEETVRAEEEAKQKFHVYSTVSNN